MRIDKIPIDTLISPEWNPRQIEEEELSKLENSLKEFGYIEPIIVNDVNNHVVGGNQRLKALKALGYTEVDVVYVHIEDINKEKACNVALNKISGEWDTEKLQIVLEDIELSDINIDLTGFDEIELTEMEITPDEPVEVVDDDYTEPDDLEVTVQQGDIYRLGNHRLMCGDSHNKEDINLLIDNNDMDMLFTDPPYGISVVNTGGGTIDGDKPFGKVGVSNHIGFNDNKGKVGGDGVVKAKEYKPVLNDDKPYDPKILLDLDIPSIIWGANNFSSKLPDSSRWLVWFKKSKGDDYDTTFSDAELAWTNYGGKSVKLYQHTWTGMVREGDRRDELTERVHPTQKPVGLLARILNDYGRERDNVLDLYGGSGSTLIACEKTNRNCYMMELDPYYCQIIINRWETYTGEKAHKIEE